MWIERTISPLLSQAAASFPAAVLTGPRQVGKTALLHHTFPGHASVELDLRSLAEAAENSPEAFFATYPPPCILDEVQNAPGLFRHVKRQVDRRPGERGLFLLSGSQVFPLMRNVSESLAGRAAIIKLLGLSGREWAEFSRPNDQAAWREFVWRGSFPALWAADGPLPDKNLWAQSYVATYLERDVRSALRVASLRDFERFLRACAIRVGQTLNKADLARDVGVAATTINDWLSVAEQAGQILLLEPYYRSLGKRLIKSPKLYFTDTGLAAFLAGFKSPAALWASPLAGAFFENHVVGQWLRWKEWNQPAASLWFWRNQAGDEVDLVVELDQKLHPIECKFKELPDRRDARSLEKFIRFYGEENVGAACVACPVPLPYPLAPHVAAIPGWTEQPDLLTGETDRG